MDHVEIRNRQTKRDERPKPVVSTEPLKADVEDHSTSSSVEKPLNIPQDAIPGSDANDKSTTAWYDNTLQDDFPGDLDGTFTHWFDGDRSIGGSDGTFTHWYDDELKGEQIAKSDGICTSNDVTRRHGKEIKTDTSAKADSNNKVHTEWFDNGSHRLQNHVSALSKTNVKQIAALFENNCFEESFEETIYNRGVSKVIGHLYRYDQSKADLSSYRDLTTHKKEVRKEGYLYKQGGVDRNQGWKKRWFTFDGKTLKYYRDQKSSVSLRMIPVTLMVSVSPVSTPKSRSSVTDLFAVSGRQFQFDLECKQRIFLFGTDSVDNCQQWQSSLMAAIIEYQKGGITDTVYGGEMSSPDISGMIKFDSNRTKYFVALKGEVLRYYLSLEDYAVDCPIHELSMTLTSVKEVKKTTLQLDSPPDQTFLLTFDVEIDAIQWKTYIENAISRALGDDKVLIKVREKEDNRVCADCSSSEPEWASINLGIVVCTKCAGQHRSLGVKRSKLRSLRMDNIFRENENVMQLLHEIGNKNANTFWYKDPGNNRVIDERTPDMIRQKHIEEKYMNKEFADVLKVNSKEELNMKLRLAVKDGNTLAAMRALFSGADMNFKSPTQNQTVFDVAKESGNNVLQEFLEQNKFTDFDAIQGERVNEKLFLDPAKKTSLYHDGYLEKTGPNLKGFMKRWCVLHYGRISYFNEKNASNQKGFVDLADATSISVVRGQRKYSFDINLQSKNRTYRFAATDETSQKEWLSCLVQVVSPFESNGYGDSLMAGYFYFKTQQSFWAKVWIFLQEQELHIRHRDDPSIEKLTLSRQMQCFQCNVGKHTEKSQDVITQLDSNQRVEIITQEGHVVAYLQGVTLKDTTKMFSLLDGVIHGHS